MPIPHFALPLRYVNGSAVVNEQDSYDDIADCVYAICSTNVGDRVELPDFGITDPTFTQESVTNPIAAEALQSQVEQWEPRATILITAAPDKYDASVVNATVNVTLSTSQANQ